MLNKVFKKFEFAHNYFSKTLGGEKFPQSIIFEGLDIFAQLFFSLELARVLNCLKTGEADCDCVNCKWIKEGKHPAVMLITPIDSKNNDSGSKTVISVKQALGITKALEETSDYHRIFILLDAKNRPLNEIENKMVEEYAPLNFELQQNWAPGALNHKIFQHTATNAILKAVEEPPNRTTFIFLTRNREDVIPTIISRSQVFKLPSLKPQIPTDVIEEIFEGYPNLTLDRALDISSALQAHEEEPEVLLSMMEEFVMRKSGNKEHFKKIAHARRQLFASMSAKTVFDALMIGFVYG